MNNRPIGVFDSGLGGLTVLKEIMKITPNENIVYFGDTARVPYGPRSKETIIKYTFQAIDFLISKNVKAIVIACNTATTKCIKMLREKYKNTIFVGTEPAIKVACDKDFKNTIVMATPGTINAERTHELVINNKKENQKIYLLPCDGLADTIEFGTKKQIKEKVSSLLNKYKNYNIDAIVLGCTHYPYAKKYISEEFPSATLIDGNKGVTKQVVKLLTDNNLLNSTNKKGKIEMIYNK